MSYCQHPAGEAVTVDRSLADFQESACSCYDEVLCWRCAK